MNELEQDKLVSVDEVLQLVRRLRDQDHEGFRRLVDEISRDMDMNLMTEVIELRRTWGYTELEVLEAVNTCGPLTVFGFLRREVMRREAEKGAADQVQGRVM